ncbi:ranBP2-like and GRIP domain-containing protein 3 [Cyrtonyx montezumae]|uniref:ranBP2-like and GRIP domain-containing protein 3 n=1 Tax=Cyrtonyx montezumae TaxID=9017 RepID=UPI0032DA9A04
MPQSQLFATSAPSADRSQSPACNAQCLRRTPATDITPAKASLCGKNGLAPQQHINAFEKVNPFNFQEPSKPLFLMNSDSDLAYRSHETEAGSTHGKSEDDDGPHFDLVVPLPDKVEESQETAEGDKADFSFGQNRVLVKVSKADGKASTSNDLGKKDDDVSKAEDSNDIHLEPIVQVPEKVEPSTGEEAEKVLHSQRVKLFRFDPNRSQWKQRGVGSLKILKNGVNVKVVLMQREQVLKVCANHWRTATVNLKELSGSGKAWMWMACDFSDGNAKLGQLAAKFRTAEQAEEFMQKFEECQQLLLDVPVRTPPKLVDTGRTAQHTEKAEETKRGLRDLRMSVTDGSTKLAKEETTNSVCASGPSDSVIKPHAEGTAPALERSKCGLRGEASSSSCVYALPLASSPVRKSLSQTGESAADSLQSASSPSSSPAKQNQSGASLKTLGPICVSSTSDRPTERVVSPPKFVFGSESVRRIFSTGKSEMVTFGNSSGTGSLFGFSFKPPGKSGDSIVTFQKAEQKEMGVAELPKSSVSPRKPPGSMASNSAPSAQDGPSNFSFKILEKVPT